MPSSTKAFAAHSHDTALVPFIFERRDPRPNDVAIDILFCGVCHSDLSTARNEWGGTLYPCVPGHEIIGRVTAVGGEVSRFVVGDIVGVGSIIGSCGTCSSCAHGEEQYCEGSGVVYALNSPDPVSGGYTLGGFSDHIVADQHYVLKVSHSERDLAAVAPLLCAGITTYSPLKHWKVGPGQKVGIVGLGGLGHIGVKIAAALGAEVFVFTTSPSKGEDALRLGARGVIPSNDVNAMTAHHDSFDFILDTVAASHDLDAFLALLKRDATLTLLGIPPEPHPSPSAFNLLTRRRAIAGSVCGGIAETQEMLDFCHEHGLIADVEVIPIQAINTAFDRMTRNDVKYRFVIDMSSLKESAV